MPALAGHYSGPVYSGGTVTVTPPGTSYGYQTLQIDGRTHWVGDRTAMGSVSCSGTVTATWT